MKPREANPLALQTHGQSLVVHCWAARASGSIAPVTSQGRLSLGLMGLNLTPVEGSVCICIHACVCAHVLYVYACTCVCICVVCACVACSCVCVEGQSGDFFV